MLGIPGLILDGADDLVALRQITLEERDGGICIGQFLQNRPCALERGSASARFPLSCCKKPMSLWLCARSLKN